MCVKSKMSLKAAVGLKSTLKADQYMCVCACVMGKVFELRYCTSIVTERKMRFSLRLNFVLLTALLEDDGR